MQFNLWSMNMHKYLTHELASEVGLSAREYPEGLRRRQVLIFD
jgi:hypothetical protein